MNYKLQPFDLKNPSQVVLERSNVLRIVMFFVFFGIGVPFLLVGLLVTLLSPDSIGLFLLGFGLLFTSAGLLFFIVLSYPLRFVFDNEAGAFIVHEGKKNNIFESVVPYHDIDFFKVRMHRTSSSGNGSSVTWMVEMAKKDGAFWTLASRQNENKAIEILEQLQQRVDLTCPYNGKEGTPVHLFQTTQTSSETIIQWEEKTSWKKSLLTLILFSGFWCALLGASAKMSGVSFRFMGLITALLITLSFGFMGLITASLVYSLANAIGKKNELSINEKEITYTERGKLSHKSKGFPVSKLRSVVFNYSIQKQDSKLYFFQDNEAELVKNVHRGTYELKDYFNAIRTMLSVQKIDAFSFTIGEVLALEKQVEDEVERITGKRPE